MAGQIPPGKTIEELYLEQNWALGGTARVERSFAFSNLIRETIREQIRKDHPEIDEREVSLRAAERVYMSDAGALALLKRARES